MKWFLMVMMFSSVGMAKPKFDPSKPYTVIQGQGFDENVLTVKFGTTDSEPITKEFKEKNEMPGFISKGGKIVCAVTYATAGDKFYVGCEGPGMKATTVVKCDSHPTTSFYDTEGEESFQVTMVCDKKKKDKI
jgi:hypothetical protein